MEETKSVTKFSFMRHNSEREIEISFGQYYKFRSCRRGTDLLDFDTLLQYFIPGIDLDKINYPIARWWERELYRKLSKCKQQRSASKAFAIFCERICKKYGKKKPVAVKWQQEVIHSIPREYIRGNMLRRKRVAGIKDERLVSSLHQQKPLEERKRQLQDRSWLLLKTKGFLPRSPWPSVW